MAKQVFIAVLLLVAFFAAPTHETTPSVEKEKATPRTRKLVGEFKDQTAVVEKLIKLPGGVMVPNQVSCFPDRDFETCPPECICVAYPEPPFPSFCACPPYTPTRETIVSVKAAAAATPIEMVKKFQDRTVEKLIKLPQGVMVPNQVSCFPDRDFDLCPPECICVVDSSEPPFSSFCACSPYTPTRETTVSVKAAAAATPIEMVEKSQDRTVEKLIKLPQGVMVPNQVSCFPDRDFDLCPPECICVADSSEPPFSSFCACPPTKTHETIQSVKALAATPKKMLRKFQDQTVEKLIKLPQRVGFHLEDNFFLLN